MEQKPMFSDTPVSAKKEEVQEPVTTHHQDEIGETPVVGNVIDLPSKGLAGYNSTITYREVLAGDEEKLKLATQKNYARTVNTVLKSICNHAQHYDDLLIHDRDFILSYIWGNTYSPVKSFEVTCKHCGHKEEEEVNIFEMDSVDLKENFKKTIGVPIKSVDAKIRVRMPTVRDENIAEKFLSKYELDDENRPRFETVMTALCIELPGGRVSNIEEKMAFLTTKVNAKEYGLIKKYHKYFAFGMKNEIEHVCSECEGVTRGDIPFLPQDIISPEVRTDFEEFLSSDEAS